MCSTKVKSDLLGQSGSGELRAVAASCKYRVRVDL